MTKSKRGGRREGAGRPQGAQSRATKVHKASLSELAREHTSTALSALVDIAQKGESESARVAAANSLLDRAYGKAPQSLQHSGPTGGPIQTVALDRLKGMEEEELKILERALVQIGLADGDTGGAGEPEE